MIYDELKTYLIVLAAEGCSKEEYQYCCKVLKQFASMVGDIDYSEMSVDHVLRFYSQLNNEANQKGLDKTTTTVAYNILKSFLCWVYIHNRVEKKTDLSITQILS